MYIYIYIQCIYNVYTMYIQCLLNIYTINMYKIYINNIY